MGQFILCDIMNAEMYLTTLREEMWPVISTWENIEDLIIMQAGAPPNLAIVREWLNVHFPGGWIGCDVSCDVS